VICFDKTFSCWHAACITKAAMLKMQLPNRDTGFEPVPRFASEAEIKLAEQLRHQLEERYFGRAAAPPTSPVRSGKDH
jgi:hypothetical protein